MGSDALASAALAALLLALPSAIAAPAAAPPPAPAPAPAPAPPSAPAPPPDAEHAEAALKASPRHGEWVDVPFAAGKAPLHTWVSYPERAGKAPVVVVIHEIFGLTDWVRGVADQLAAEGFIAVAPDLLSGMGPDGGGTPSFKGDAVREAISRLTPADVNARLDAVRAWAVAQPAAAPSVACIGFCWGGSASFNWAVAQPPLAGAVVYYGTAAKDDAALAAIACPVLGFYGGDDARVTSTVEPTVTRMKAAGKSYTPRTFDGAGHGFLRQQGGREGANQRAAGAAWADTIAFLRQRSGDGAAAPGTPAAPRIPAAPKTPEAPAVPGTPAAPTAPAPPRKPGSTSAG